MPSSFNMEHAGGISLERIGNVNTMCFVFVHSQSHHKLQVGEWALDRNLGWSLCQCGRFPSSSRIMVVALSHTTPILRKTMNMGEHNHPGHFAFCWVLDNKCVLKRCKIFLAEDRYSISNLINRVNAWGEFHRIEYVDVLELVSYQKRQLTI